MSSEASSGEQFSTTTVSSVAVQAGNSRIVIAILKSGKWVQLQLAEAEPNLLEIGSSQDETKKLLQDHEQLLVRLKSLEDQVWDLLREADKTAEENKEQSQVYDAMAETLGDAWDALVIVLEKRRKLLKITAVFFENALEFAIKIDQVEEFLQNSQEFEDVESLKELLQQHEHHTKELLEKSLALLNKSHELTGFIDEFKSDGPNINPELIQGAHSSCLKIDSLLELLQDRRRQLDKYLKHQRQGLKQVLQICQWHHQENQVTSLYKKDLRDYLHKQNLGSSLTENKELLCEHKEMEFKAKEWNFTVGQLKAEALKILLSEDYAEKEHLKLSNQKITLLQEEVCRHMEERKKLLQEASDFFNAANKETSHQLEAAVRIIKEGDEFEPEEMATFSNKAELLNEELKTLSKNISSKLDILKAYVAFLKSAKEVNDDAERLKEFFKSDALHTDNEMENKTVMETAETQWQTVVKKILSTENMGHGFLNLVNMVNENLILKSGNVVGVTKEALDNLNKVKEDLTEIWTTWKLQINQVKSIKQQSWKLKEQFKKTTHSSKILQEALKPATTVDLGSNLHILLDLQKKINQMKPEFQQLSAEVEYMVKLSELLSLKGVPGQENSEKVSELIHLHQKIKDMMTEYDDILNKTVKFHHVKEKMDCLIKSGELEIPETNEVPGDAHQVKLHLTNTLEKHTHIRHLYKLALTLGVDILSAVQKPCCLNVSVKNLQQELATLENDSINWSTKADKYEEELSHNFQYCTTKEEINECYKGLELRESFKDLKKKFNNLKFNYTKKTEKARNLKVLKIQIQQVDMYAEKMQILRKKADNLEKKTTSCVVNQPDGNVGVLMETVRELQKQLNEFGRVVEDYKQNLDLMEHLQQLMEECQYWYEEASATVIRVGKYSAECKTQEAVEILYKQFNKFIQPTVPQQEERIQQFTDLAKRLYGFEEGSKYVEKVVAKHEEVLDSINELCNSLKQLEREIEKDVLKEETPNIECFVEEAIIIQKEQARNKQELYKDVSQEKEEEPNLEEENKLADISDICPAGEDFISQYAELSSSAKEDSLQTELLAEEMPSGDEYECISPDDISLPPLSETPESNLLHSETELEDQSCCSSHSLHVSSYSLQMQINTTSKRMTDESGLLTTIAYADTTNQRRENASNQSERFLPSTICHHPKFRVQSPLTYSSPETPETSTAFCIVNARPGYSMMGEVCEKHLQHCEIHKSMTETQEQLHGINNFTKTQDRLHALPGAFSDLMFQSDATRSCQRQMVTREEIKSASEKNSMVSLSGQAPNFSQLLSNVTVMEGSPVTLEAEVTGFPEPTLTWYKKGQKLTADEHFTLLQKETKHTLFIQKVFDTDAGLYVARAKNSNGTISSSAILHVKVQGKLPDFIQKFGHKTLQQGEDLILHCTVHGRPRPNVVWTKDDIQVVDGDISVCLNFPKMFHGEGQSICLWALLIIFCMHFIVFQIDKLGDSYYLLKRNVVLADTGKYVCIASNEVGEAHCSAFIKVIGDSLSPDAHF
ncbi:coiled-coil domain-containing protein 141 isoform X10 [Alligator sinensis]|uniref:Coiled-coil domain-containing protein 141 isoform X10 n=1 Tax=Alligator sinensis TaxID=38654 RepID=A0A3Q0HKX7_ALLSI|nr:coiled-coil domain-containing protein 141 isoform X10 [Alligator sinensis]